MQLRVVVVLVLAALAACSPAPDEPAAGVRLFVRDGADLERTVATRVAAVDWGAQWPFTTADATLVCVPALGERGRFVIVDGQPFAATGGAMAVVRQFQITIDAGRGARRPVLFNIEEQGVDRYWRTVPEGSRVSFAPVLAAIERMPCS